MSNLEKFVAAGVVNADTVTEQEKALIERLSPEEHAAILRLRRNNDSGQRVRESGNIVL
jgi:hypothetical protein